MKKKKNKRFYMIKRLPFMQKIEFYKTAVKLVMLGNE